MGDICGCGFTNWEDHDRLLCIETNVCEVIDLMTDVLMEQRFPGALLLGYEIIDLPAFIRQHNWCDPTRMEHLAQVLDDALERRGRSRFLEAA